MMEAVTEGCVRGNFKKWLESGCISKAKWTEFVTEGETK